VIQATSDLKSNLNRVYEFKKH